MFSPPKMEPPVAPAPPPPPKEDDIVVDEVKRRQRAMAASKNARGTLLTPINQSPGAAPAQQRTLLGI